MKKQINRFALAAIFCGLFGDDAIFQNRFLDEQNRLLAKNLARRLK